MTARALSLSVQQALVEEVVLRAIAGHRAERPFRHGRDKLYVLPEEQRDRAFGEFHTQWFAQLALGQPIVTALAELPLLAESCARCVVTRASTHHDEGADLLVAPDAEGPAARTVSIQLCPSSFGHGPSLLALLRAELLHVADMLDPDFGYEPTLPSVDGGPSYERLLRDRYRAVWDVSVIGRLVRRGVLDESARATAYRAFAAAFPMLGDAAAPAAFSRFFTGTARTHAELLAFASVPRAHKPAEGLAAGGRCPLCRFPTYAPESAPEQLSETVVAQIIADFPTWRPGDGLCSQCAELYRSRPLSVSAAALLPRA